MGRKRKTITPEGFTQCSRCGTWKHVAEFYQQAGVYDKYINPQGVEVWFGKPNSWCKTCQLEHNKKHQQKVRLKRSQELQRDGELSKMTPEERKFQEDYVKALEQGILLSRKPDGTYTGTRLEDL